MGQLLLEVRSKFRDVVDSGMVLLALLLSAAGALVLYFGWYDQMNRRSGVPVVATITDLRPVASAKYRPGMLVMVYAKDAHGIAGQEAFPLLELAGCKVGDHITAKRGGITLTLEPAPCPVASAGQ